MSIFSKFKDKLTRGLRKVTPKEIAPALPFLAMAVPGMGFASNALLRYGLPQLLTAAGSARTSGKISPLNQALAGLASYSAGPGSMASTPDQKAFMTNRMGDTIAAPTPGNTQAFAQSLGKPINIPKGTTYDLGMTGTEFSRANPASFKKFRQENSVPVIPKS